MLLTSKEMTMGFKESEGLKSCVGGGIKREEEEEEEEEEKEEDTTTFYEMYRIRHVLHESSDERVQGSKPWKWKNWKAAESLDKMCCVTKTKRPLKN